MVDPSSLQWEDLVGSKAALEARDHAVHLCSATTTTYQADFPACQAVCQVDPGGTPSTSLLGLIHNLHNRVSLQKSQSLCPYPWRTCMLERQKE